MTPLSLPAHPLTLARPVRRRNHRPLAAALAIVATAVLGPSVRPAVAQTASATTATGLTGADRWADSARVAIEAAHVRRDRPALAAVRTLLGRALVVTPGDPLLLHYLGYAQYREGVLAMTGGDADAARTLLESADTLLARSGERRPLAETYALHASVLGMLIATGNPMSAMVLGPRAGAAMARAERLGPRNPRVALLRGVSAFNTPSMWGGGMDKARTYLERAVALSSEDRAAAPLPTWGAAEAHVWLGRVRQRGGDTAGARAAYTQALTLQPDNVWVSRVLLPSLDRPNATGTR